MNPENRDGKRGWPPVVTVVVPAFNSEGTLVRCLHSLLQQDYPAERYSVIVVDNKSTDQTASIARSFPVELVYEGRVQTPGAARNRGIALAEGEVLAFIDSDCIAEQAWLSNLVHPFQDATVGVAGGTIRSLSPSSSLVEAFLAEVKVSDGQQFQPAEPMGFPSGNVAYRRSALQRVGVFDPALPGGEDVDLAWRTQAFGGYRGVFVPEAVVSHQHGSSITRLFHQFRGYGNSEILLSTLYRGQGFHQRTPARQIRDMLRQVRALTTYCMSFLVRLTRWSRWKSDHLYLAWPILWFVLESGNLVGKLQGLARTRGFHRNPYHGGLDEVNRAPVAPIGNWELVQDE